VRCWTTKFRTRSQSMMAAVIATMKPAKDED
jgi:hypothetical protein